MRPCSGDALGVAARFQLSGRTAVRTKDSSPLAVLWRPQLSVFLELEFGLSGLERSAKAMMRSDEKERQTNFKIKAWEMLQAWVE